MAFHPTPKPCGVRLGDKSFAARVGYGLLQKIGASARLKQVGYRSFDCRDLNTFLNRDVAGGEVGVMNNDASWCLAAQPRVSGHREMDRCRTCVGNPLNRERGSVRDGDGFGAAIGFGPEHGFPVLRELSLRKMRNPVHAARDALDAPALDEPGEDRVRKALGAGLPGGNESVVFFGQGGEFIEA